jgi:hypothetical protein
LILKDPETGKPSASGMDQTRRQRLGQLQHAGLVTAGVGAAPCTKVGFLGALAGIVGIAKEQPAGGRQILIEPRGDEILIAHRIIRKNEEACIPEDLAVGLGEEVEYLGDLGIDIDGAINQASQPCVREIVVSMVVLPRACRRPS